MDDTSQIQPPESFANLFRSRAGLLKTPIAEVVARYELCEDLACHLVEQAQTLYHVQAPSEAEILRRIHAGLSSPGAGTSPAEAVWVVQRLAELLQWRCPDLPGVQPEDGSAQG